MYVPSWKDRKEGSLIDSKGFDKGMTALIILTGRTTELAAYVV
jgi:hypothetical protein